MRDYELQKYKRWQVEMENILPQLMKRNILAVAGSADVGGSQVKREMVGGVLPHEPRWILQTRYHVFIVPFEL